MYGAQAMDARTLALRRAVAWVALNLGYAGIEVSIARAIGSVALLADSVDFLEDASVNLLIPVALGWSAQSRARVGTALAVLLLVPAIATLWAAWETLNAPVAPDPMALSLVGLGALLVDLGCAALLVHHRYHAGSLTRAAYLSARNDALAKVALWRSARPDPLVGFAIAAINADAACEVWEAARDERDAA